MRNEEIKGWQKGKSLDQLTMRDHFATAALQGILAGNSRIYEDEFVEKAYRLADNMLVYRDQTGNS